MMKALYFDGKLSLREVPKPVPAPGEALIKVLFAGICGTDREILKGYSGFHGIPGHEFVGRVVECVQTTLKGSSDAFVSKLNPTGSSLLYSTYLGGSGIDQANGIAVTSGGVVDVTGFTESSDFPTQAPVQSVLGLSNNQLCGSLPCADAFVTQFNSRRNGANLLHVPGRQRT